MAKFYGFLIIIFLAALSLLAYLNKGTVGLTVWEGKTYELPIISLILISTFIGIFSILIVVVIRDARRYVDYWQKQRQEKKAQKVQEVYSKGRDAFFASRYDEASELFQRTIESNPSHVNALLRLGDIYFSKDDLTKARDYYTKANKIKPRSVEILLSLEKLSEKEKKWQEALRYLDNILEINDENISALYRKRNLYEANKKWAELLDVQYKIIKSDIPIKERQKEQKNLLGYKYELGNHYLEEGAKEKAIKVLRSLIKADPNFKAAYLLLAEAYLKEGNVEEAEDILEKGFNATAAFILLARLEDHLIAMGEPGKTIELYQKAIQKDPGNQKLQFFLAKLYYRLEMIDYALETAAAIDTALFDSSNLHILLGNIYERRSQHSKAVEEFKKAMKTEKPFMSPFCCAKCGYTSKEWTGRCPECRLWNTFTLDIDGTCKA
ncbi:MAG: tetratricopeptide repeat protein [Nitrospirota bacterium]